MHIISHLILLSLLVSCQSPPKDIHNSTYPILPKDGAEAIQYLKEGNVRFLEDSMVNVDYPQQIKNTSIVQHPYAFILSCIDARVPPEIIFDQGIGNIFVARVAGNIHDDYILGSMEYAVAAKHCKLIVVMGHSNCGAVKGAMNNIQMGHLTAIANQIKPSLDEDGLVRSFYEEHTDEMTRNNVVQTIKDIMVESTILKKHIESKELRIAAAFYNTNSGRVDFFDYE